MANDILASSLRNLDQYNLNNTAGDARKRLEESARNNQQYLQNLYQQRVDHEEAYKNSLVGKLGLEDGGVASNTVNRIAAFGNTVNRMVGEGIALPMTIANAIAQGQLSERDVQAYQNYKNGTATEDEMGILAESVGADIGLERNTKLQNIESLVAQQDKVKNIREFFDGSSVVNQGNKNELVQDLEGRYDQSSFEGKSALGKLTEAGKLAAGAVGAAIDNPSGVMDYVAENLPQMGLGLLGAGGRAAMAASNVGYGTDIYAKGVEEYTKANGKLPTGADQLKIAGWAASAAAAEQAGDMISLKGLQDIIGKPVAKTASDVGAKQVGSGGLTGLAKGTVGAIGGEAATEAFQTFAENSAEGKETTGKDLYTSAAIGGMVGGAIRGGVGSMQVAGEALADEQDKGAEVVAQREANKKEVDEAAKTGNVDALTKVSSPTYNPTAAVEALVKHSADSKDEAVTKQNLEKASAIVTEAEANAADLKSRIDAAKNPEQAIAAVEQEVVALQKKSEEATDQDLKDSYAQQAELKKMDIEDIQADVNGLERLERKYKAAQAIVTKGPDLLKRFNSEAASTIAPEEVTAPTSTDSVAKVLNLSMSASDKVPTASLENIVNSKNSTEEQKKHARAALAARQAEEAAKSIEEVNTDVLYGNSKSNMVGVENYRQRIGAALTAGNTKAAENAVAVMKAFQKGHRSKADLAKAVLAERIASGTNESVTIVKGANGIWERATGTVPSSVGKNNKLVIHRGSNGRGLIDAIGMEADAIDAGVAEMEAAIASSKSSPTKPSVEAKASPSAPTATTAKEKVTPVPATEKVVAESTVSEDKDVGKGKGETNQPQVASPESSKETPKEDTKQSQSAKKAVRGLTVFTKKVPTEEVGKLGESFKKLNLVAQFFTQRKEKSTDASVMPLVSEDNFLDALNSGEVSINDFLEVEADATQVTAVNHLLKFVGKHLKTIEKNFARGQSEYSYNEMSSFLKNDDGSVDQNVLTAIAVAGYTWLAENGNKPDYNDDDAIRAIFGMDDTAEVSNDLRQLAIRGGVNERNVIASLGQKVMSTLGLQATKEAPVNLQPTLEAALGAQAWKLLDQLGLLERKEIPAEVLSEVFASTGSNVNEMGSVYLTRPTRDTEGKIIQAVKDISDAQKGQGSVINKMFGVESQWIAPRDTPNKKKQEFTAGTNQPAPKKMQEVQIYEDSVPNYLRQDTWGVVTALGFEAFKDVSGFDRTDPATLHKTKRDGFIAKNDGVIAQIENALDFFTKRDPDAPMFFEHSIWKQMRMGIKTNLINPQTSKIHRFLVSRPEWKSEVHLNIPSEVDSLKFRIAEGLKIKTDKKSNDQIRPEVEAKLNDPVITAAADALIETMINGEVMSDAHREAIVAGVKAGKMQMHSMDALIALAKLRDAEAKGKSTVTVELMGEIDGVTNGPMLSHLLLGAAASAKDLFSLTNRGGFFSLDDAQDNYNVWRGEAGHKDLYEVTIENVLSKMKVEPKLAQAFNTIVGEVKPNGDVEVNWRDQIKTPMTAMIFGSSLKGAVNSMFDKFTDTIYEKMAEAHNKPELKATYMRAINDLMRSQGMKEKDLFNNSHDLLETTLTKQQENALRKAFDQIIGDAVVDSMNTDFAVFMNARKAVNTGAQAAFKLYDAARKGITEKFIADKIESGDIAYRTLKNGTKEPLHDLTPALKEELGGLLLPITPVQATLMTNDSNQPTAGLEVAKSGRHFSTNPVYRGEMKFGTPTSTGTTSQRIAAYEFSLASPGVAMLVMSVHSTDSAISHNAVMGFGEPTQVLNVHDAHGSGLQHFFRTANNLNRATWDALLRYSPATEMNKTLQRTINGLNEVLADSAYAEAIRPYLKDAVVIGKGKGQKKLSDVVTELANEAAAGDKIKYEAMSLMKTVDQYALEGGEYRVTEEDRKQAKDLIATAVLDLSPQVMDAIEAISGVSRKQGETKTVATDPEFDSEPAVTPVDSLAKTVAPVAIANAIETVPEAAPLKEAMQSGKSLKEAAKELPEAVQAKAVQAVASAAQKVKSAFSPWGEIGNSTVVHDSQLVADMEATPVMNKEQVFKALGDAILRQGSARTREFNVKLYQALKKLAPENLQVKYVTPSTSSKEVMGKGAEKSRGWYMTDGSANQIYVLSTDHKYSAITPEILLHELTHSVLAGLVESELDKRKDNPSYKSEALQLIDNLEELRVKAQGYVEANGLNTLSPAVANVHEFISWGMTNQEFQRSVLNNISARQSTASNSFITGMKKFIDSLVGILFKGSDKSSQKINANGMALMIKNTSGLFHAASQNKSSTDILLNQEAVDPLTVMDSMSPVDMYESLVDSNPRNQPSAGFDAHLKEVLSGLASKIHAPMEPLLEIARADRALSAMDVYTKALATGKLPFAAKSVVSGFKVNNQEAFVMEQVEATMRAALNSSDAQTTAAYSELRRVHALALKKVRPMDLLPEGVTEATASQAQKDHAKALWNAAFRVEAGTDGKSDYMPQFVALALAHEGFASKLGFDATRKERDPNNIWDRFMAIVDRVVNAFLGKLTRTSEAGTAAEFVMDLAEALVHIESKRKAATLSQFEKTVKGVEDKMNEIGSDVQQKIMDVAKSDFFKNSKNGFVRVAGVGASVIAAPERVHKILDGVQAFRDQHFKERQGVLSSLITEFNGLEGSKEPFLRLLLGTKNIERHRAEMTSSISKLVLESFAKKKFSALEEKALTQVFMRNDLGSLVNSYSIAEIHNLLSDPAYLNAEIQKLEGTLRKTKFANHILNQTEALGYFMATGKNTHSHLLLNAHNIARLGGTDFMGQISESVSAAMEPNIDVLASLFAIKHTNQSLKSAALNVMRDEMNRTDGSNGVELLMKLHKELQRDSKERLFDNNEALAIKGYLPEITNPYISFKVAGPEEELSLVKQGYVKKEKVGNDNADPSAADKHIYVLRDGGMQRFLTGALSYTGNQRKGSSNQRDNGREVADIYTYKQIQTASLNGGRFHPENVKETHMVPVLSAAGQVVNYRYMMENEVRDDLLERDNRFEHLLASMAGDTFDKLSSPHHNRAIIEALKQQYDAEKGTDLARYQSISPKSSDSEFRDLWNMLPDQTKNDIEQVFGSQEVLVRNDMLDLIFGYRKQSLSQLWDKENRKFYEDALVWVTETMLKAYAVSRGLNEDEWVGKAKAIVRNGEDIWQAVVAETKDIIVVRSGFVLWGNILSNLSVLRWEGVPFKDIIRHHRVAIKAAQDYQRDTYQLGSLETQLESDYLMGKDRDVIEQEVLRLKDAINRNPVKELIDAGLMPTIAEDLSAADNIYSYKNMLGRKIDAVTKKVPKTVRKAANFVYMGQDTPLYKGLNRATQLSDFVARYTLFHHLTEKADNPLSKEEAIKIASDDFVNYDIPTHRSVQYMNDMGFLMFTKYYVRIQKVILRLWKEKPMNGLMLLLMGGYVEGVETIHDSNMLSRIGNNPFSLGAVRYGTVLDDLATVNGALGLR